MAPAPRTPARAFADRCATGPAPAPILAQPTTAAATSPPALPAVRRRAAPRVFQDRYPRLTSLTHSVLETSPRTPCSLLHLHIRPEHFLKLASCPMDPGFHLRHARAQRLGDLDVREVLVLAQHQ